MTTPPTEQQLDEIAKAVADYRQHPDIGFACCTAHPVADAGAALVAEVRRQRTELATEQRRHGDTIDDRDRAQDAADKLAYAVAPENVIGEHTADNSPWENALDLLTPMAEVDRLRTELAAVHAFLDEQDRAARLFELPTPAWVKAVRAASVPPAAPLRPSHTSSASESTQIPTGAPEGALGASGAEQRDRRERYARAIHDAMEPDLSLVDQEPACQALFARAAEAAVALADTEAAEDLASADNPIHLRWGLNDVLWSDDDSVIVMLSGPDREAYWLELDPTQAAVLRQDLAGPDGAQSEAIHTHFGLSYCNYLVLPRTLLQSMPDEWQTPFVALLDQLETAFRHIPQAERYRVEAATEHIVGEMTDTQLAEAGIEADWYGGEIPPKELGEQELAEWRAQYEQAQPEYYRIGDAEELDRHMRVLLPAPDPIPHYDRGRARIEPAVEETHIVADDSSDLEHVDDCPGCAPAHTTGGDR